MLKFGVIKKTAAASLLFLLLTLFITGSLPAKAIEYGGLGGRPAYPRADNPRTESVFIYTLETGTTQKDGVRVINNTQEQKTIMIYAADFTPSTGGAFACKQFADSKVGVGAWITLAKSEVTLKSGASEIVSFTIQVPENADVGENSGCILIQEKKAKAKVRAGMNLSIRTGLRVAITIPGEIIKKLEIVDFTVDQKENGDFLLHPFVKNTGNVSIDTDVLVVTRYFFGTTLSRHGGQYPILRGGTSDWNFELKKPFWGGVYRSKFTVEYDANPEAEIGEKSNKMLTHLEGPSVWFWSFPALAALAIEIVVLLFIAFCGFLFWLSRKRKRWIQKNWVEYRIQSGKDIQELAKKFNVSWKLLAKVNKLKPPYALKAGEKIKVPPRS